MTRTASPSGCGAAARRACASTGRCGRRRAGDVSRVEIQNAPFGSSDFRTVATIDVRSRNGTFVRTLPRREGRFRLRWGSVLSREASIAGE